MRFIQFLRENRYTYLYHGTSSVFKAGILKHGLMPGAESVKDSKEDGVNGPIKFMDDSGSNGW